MLKESLIFFISSVLICSESFISYEGGFSWRLICWLLCVLLSCVLEEMGVSDLPQRNNSPGLYYGCALAPAILLGIKHSQGRYVSESPNSEILEWTFDVIITFSLWFLIYKVFFKLSNKYVSNTSTSFPRLFIFTVSGICMQYVLKCNISGAVLLCMILVASAVTLVIKFLPNCFTCGELLLHIQLLSSFFMMFLYSQMQTMTAILSCYAVLFVVVFAGILILVNVFDVLSTTLFYALSVSSICILLLITFWSLPVNVFIWAANFLSDNFPNRQILILFWIFELTVCTGYVTFRASEVSSSTSERKYFHIFILLTFVPGIIYDIELLLLGSIAATSLLVILEVIRLLNVTPLAPVLNEKFTIFLDPQDSGRLILTPIYLILGQSLPIWATCFLNPSLFIHTGTVSPIAVYSGILSVGIGDTAASVIGSKYGRVKWPDTKKSVEGTVASFLSQLVFAFFIAELNSTFFHSVFAIAAVSLVEAFTSQIDNLVLPVYMYFLLITSL